MITLLQVVRRLPVLLLFLGLAFHARSEVFVSKSFATDSLQRQVDVGAGKYWALPLPSRPVNDVYEVRVDLGNAVYKDISAFVVDEENMGRFRQRRSHHATGVQKGIAPFSFRATIRSPGKHYLVLDNSNALIINKNVTVVIKQIRTLPDSAAEYLKVELEKMYGGLKLQLLFPDFNISVRPCGQANAFSSLVNGDIILCTEMISRLAKKPGALLGVLSHELGHTLLNLWGIPGGDNEDIADEFASVVLLAREDGGKAIEEYAAYFERGNTEKEAEFILRTGDRHSLSIQRIRNIRGHAIHASVLFHRWNRQLYPHMTEDALRQVVDKPSANDDAALARMELARRFQGN